MIKCSNSDYRLRSNDTKLRLKFFTFLKRSPTSEYISVSTRVPNTEFTLVVCVRVRLQETGCIAQACIVL